MEKKTRAPEKNIPNGWNTNQKKNSELEREESVDYECASIFCAVVLVASCLAGGVFPFFSVYDLCTGNTLTRLILFCISLVSSTLCASVITNSIEPILANHAVNQPISSRHRMQFAEQTKLWKNWKFNKTRSNWNAEWKKMLNKKTRNADFVNKNRNHRDDF